LTAAGLICRPADPHRRGAIKSVARISAAN
jgi:hypothetical protein